MKTRTILGLFLCVGFCGLVSAQNPDYTMIMSDGIGNPGGEAIVTASIDNLGMDIQGWSFSICHDGAVIEPVDTQVGADAAVVNNGDLPDFFFTEWGPDGVQCLAVVSFFETAVLGQGLSSLLDVTYQLNSGPGVTTTVAFCDTVGTPPTETLVVVEQASIIPVQQSGDIEITGTPIPPSFGFVAPNTGGNFDSDTGAGTVIVTPTIQQTFGVPSETLGFFMGLAHDAGILEVGGASPAGPLLALNGGSGPDIFLVDAQVGGVTISVEYAAGGAETIPFPAATGVVDIEYVTNAPALQGMMFPVSSPLTWSNTLGVGNEVVYAPGPDIVSAALDDGSVTMSPSGVPFVDYLLRIPDMYGPSGGSVDAQVLLDNLDPALGWSWGVCHDDIALTLVSVEQGISLLTVNGGAPPAFYQVDTYATGFTLGCVVDFFGVNQLEPGFASQMNVMTYDILGPDGTETEIEFCGTLGNPMVEVIMVAPGGISVVPQTENGTVEIGSVGAEFIRGDTNGDGVLNALVDGIFILNYQFVPGSDEPPCLDAADADDDGTINGLLEGILLLNFGFVPGSTPPPAPTSCGNDPTPDTLECEAPPCP